MDDDKKGRGIGWTDVPKEARDEDYTIDRAKTKLCNDGTRVGSSEDLIEDMLTLESKARKRGDIQMEISARMHRLVTAGAGEAMYQTESDLSRRNCGGYDGLYLTIVPAAINAFASALTSFFISGRASEHGISSEEFAAKAGSKCVPKKELIQMCELAARSMYKDCASVCDLDAVDLKELDMDTLRKSVTASQRSRPKGDGSVMEEDDNVVLRLVDNDSHDDTIH